MISSYKAAQLHMAKARNKAKGRPMKGAGWRLFQDGDEYVVQLYDVAIGRFLPDNTFVFSVGGTMAYSVAHSLSATTHRNLPFQWMRVGPKKYRVDHERNIDGYPWQHFSKPTNAPIVYPGLTFDLGTGRCLNPLPDENHKPKVDTDRRRVWLAALRAWKLRLKAAARVGAFDALITAEKANPTHWADRPRWHTPEGLDILYKAIKDGDLSTELLQLFVASLTPSWRTPTSREIYEGVDRLTKTYSVELRERFGVFHKGE